MIKATYRIAGRPYDYVELEISEETWVQFDQSMDELLVRAETLYRRYEDLDDGRDVVQADVKRVLDEATAATVAMLDAGLGVTVLETIERPSVPGPEAQVTPAWERPADPAPGPEAPAVNTSVNWEGF